MLDALASATIGEDRAVGQVPLGKGTLDAKKPALIVLHQENSNPGHIGQWFLRNGHHLDIRKPRFGESLPPTLKDHCGAVIFGGPMSANDRDEFIRSEIEWIGVALEEKAPFLGICLGAQMLTLHLGAKVGFDPEQRAEMGYYPLATTAEGRSVGPFPDHVYQWHREGCELPAGARLLATSDGGFPVQAFSVAEAAFAVQFHPEITYAQVHRWTGHHATRLEMKGAQAREQHISGHVAHARKVQAWLDGFLGQWVAAGVSRG